MIIQAPAKVNVHLAVLDKRSDGFHNIESLFVALDFGDILHFEPVVGGEGGIVNRKDKVAGLELILEGPFAKKLTASGEFPIEKNIIFKALSLFREKTDFSNDIKIRVEKNIPAGGGLGGGSSNAASTLLALNKLAGCPLEQDELLNMGAALGSDVPFFLHQIPAARVTGRGEQIEPVESPSRHFVLVNPGFASNTGTAFKLLDKSRADGQSSLNSSSCPPCLRAPGERQFSNDFLSVLPEKSTYTKIISQLTKLGAESAGLSGSGSTCFGVFLSKKDADKAALSLYGEWDFIQSCSVIKY